jgi:1,2-phenylacetyl-CoA epoxidase catalytic subunit
MADTPDDLTDVPAKIQHLASLNRRSDLDTTITRTEHGYHVLIKSTVRDRSFEMTMVRQGRRWVGENPKITEDGVELDNAGEAGDLTGLLRAMSQSGDMVGSTTANTRHQRTSPNLVIRSHTVIRN